MKIGIIHTTKATIDSLGDLVKEIIQDVEVIHILDDSILPDMRDRHDVDFVRERWMGYARNLERMGVQAILSACSTVGEFAQECNEILEIPVYRIDEAMVLKAVSSAQVISVFATLRSTLEPTVSLVKSKAKEMGKEIIVHTVLVDGAYEILMDGNKKEHDQMILQKIKEYLDQSDVILLAQASMASAVSNEPEMEKKVLTSPRLGILKLREDLSK